MEDVDAMLGELLHLAGGHGRSDQLAGLGIVVDAFDYRELKKKGRDAKRMWSTFISAPKQGKQKFSEIAAALARNAAPYFGETSKGLQVYSDTRAEVKIGEIIEVKDDAARK